VPRLRSPSRGGRRRGRGRSGQNDLGFEGKAVDWGVFVQAATAGQPSDLIRWPQGARRSWASFGPGGTPLSRPRPRLWPGARVRAACAGERVLGWAALTMMGHHVGSTKCTIAVTIK
jgi:hypothetical protein